MEANIDWRFPPLDGGTKQGFNNNDIEAFKGELVIDNLAREICQNSLDARVDAASGPVSVVFELRMIRTGAFPLFSRYGDFIAACRDYYSSNMGHQLKHFLDDAELMLSLEEMPLLVVSDHNTYGLRGSRTLEIGDPWEALTSADGISAGKDEGSGGSYGIGKNAPFACSAMRTVFYNTLDVDGQSAFTGVGRLATFYDKDLDDDTQRIGRYQNNDTEHKKYLPIYPEDSDEFRDLFVRQEGDCGTDVIIAGFSFSENWAHNVKKAVAKNFFVAIAERSLVVEIVDGGTKTVLNENTLANVLEGLKDESDMMDTLRLFEAYTHSDFVTRLSIESEGDVEVRIASRPNFGKKIANFRNTGMLINTYFRRIFQNYAAVVIVQEKGLSDLLKKTEPAKHDNWDHRRIQGNSDSARKERERARIAIKKIREQILALLREQYETIPEKTVDAVGVGNYLPDSVDSGFGNGKGDDALRPIVKLGKSRVVRREIKDEVEVVAPGKKTWVLRFRGTFITMKSIMSIPIPCW
ncbi:MAG: hypothetical protein KH142_05310 [Slackia piriformis]|uniref:Uncharacterized protein n=1 Tax=Slackia piriformis TaxID=626934 RepID=A0A943V0F1_9ACTN|nr:hypothetical protein [Slackia piriformis]